MLDYAIFYRQGDFIAWMRHMSYNSLDNEKVEKSGDDHHLVTTHDYLWYSVKTLLKLNNIDKIWNWLNLIKNTVKKNVEYKYNLEYHM